jgi:hypothetical protein
MDLKETLAIAGQGGLFRFVSQGRNGIVVESFADKKRTFVPATTKVLSLDDIAIYTSDKEIPLKDVFKQIFELEKGERTLEAKTTSPDELKKYMERILPEYDRDRVYVSDIKKLLTWYNILHGESLLTFDEESEPAGTGATETHPENELAKATTLKDKPVRSKAKSTEKKPDIQVKSMAGKTPKKERSPVKK